MPLECVSDGLDLNIGVIIYMQENFVNILFQKGLTLDDIIKLLNIEKLKLQQPKSEFLHVIGQQEPIEVKVRPLYILTDINGKEYYI